MTTEDRKKEFTMRKITADDVGKRFRINNSREVVLCLAFHDGVVLFSGLDGNTEIDTLRPKNSYVHGRPEINECLDDPEVAIEPFGGVEIGEIIIDDPLLKRA